MPLNRTPLTGGQTIAAANVTLRRTYTIAAGANPLPYSEVVNEIAVLGLPRLMYWVRLTTNQVGCQAVPLYAVDNTTVANVIQPIWLPFTNGNILVPGNVFVFTIQAAVANAAVELIVPVNTAVNFEVVITAGA